MLTLSASPDYFRAGQELARLYEFWEQGEKATMGMGRTHFLKAEGVVATGTAQKPAGENQ